jgi:hypothetical protein
MRLAVHSTTRANPIVACPISAAAQFMRGAGTVVPPTEHSFRRNIIGHQFVTPIETGSAPQGSE